MRGYYGWECLNRTGLIVAVKPDKQDFAAVDREYGPLPPTASKAARAERYRLAQAAKIIRQLEQVVLTGNANNEKRKPKL